MRGRRIGGDYFGLMEMPVVRGRAFAATDRPDAPRVAVVNESFARRYWPGSEAVGRTFTISAFNSAYACLTA